jgi:hypothetical protein
MLDPKVLAVDVGVNLGIRISPYPQMANWPDCGSRSKHPSVDPQEAQLGFRRELSNPFSGDARLERLGGIVTHKPEKISDFFVRGFPVSATLAYQRCKT